MSILSRWPTILQDLLEFQRIAEGQQPDFDEAAEIVNTLHNEFSLFTMSERGVSRWEEILGIQRRDGDTLEVRRDRILTKYLSQLPYTYRKLLRYVGQISTDYAVDLDTANYELFVSVLLSGYDQRTALTVTLTDMLPANIQLKLQAKIQQAVDNAQTLPVLHMTHKVYSITTPIERGTA